MRRFWKEMRTQENLKENYTKIERDLICEEAIIKDKERFGRIRTHLMKQLRVKYGTSTANRAMWRVNKRESKTTQRESSYSYLSNNLPNSV